MNACAELALKTWTYSGALFSEHDLARDFSCVFAESGVDDRSNLPVWKDRLAHEPALSFAIRSQEPDHIVILHAGTEKRILLQDDARLRGLFAADGTYIDISGLAHHVWAPLVRVALQTSRNVRAIYAEPGTYRLHTSPASPNIFDLSTGFGGISPLPGFARLQGPTDESMTILVALLGFEGMRARQIALNLDPPPTTIPIIGVPGFKAGLPTFTVSCNREFLDETRSFPRVRFAKASCPFEALATLREIRCDYPNHYLYVAPIGTKPHALGAVLFALENTRTCELMYDHPVRSLGRSKDVGAIHVYRLRES